jgi:putative Ca2+/H+ antiporter (TMEM165/GDT1 family)/protein-S-isoprenylcysteine O-methyltransferase Ste14
MDGVLIAFAVSFGVVFVAELGDKSQLMALTFATRYRALPVLIGITIATTVVHAVSVAVGHGLGSALPTGWIALVAAVAFFGFGAWTLRGDTLTDDERAKAERSTGSAVAVSSVAFFLAELGDKTMLATITLATQYGWFGTWIGSTVGMVAADALAIVVGGQLARHLPEKAIKYGAGGLFFLFGAWLLVDASAQWGGISPTEALARALDHHAGWIALGLGLVAVLLGTVGRRRMRRVGVTSGRPARRAGNLAWWVRALFAVAVLLGLGAPLLVATDVVQPIALFDEPGWLADGAAVVLLGTALLLAAQRSRGTLQERGADPVTATHGLHARVRNPGLTGIALATAGLLLMVPTLLGVLAAVLVVVAVQIQVRAVQIQVRAVREPGLARRHGEAYEAYAARTGRFLPRPPARAAAPTSAPDRGRG